jgi:hypothetical protein
MKNLRSVSYRAARVECILERGCNRCFMHALECGNVGIVFRRHFDGVALRKRLELTTRLHIPLGLVGLAQP